MKELIYQLSDPLPAINTAKLAFPAGKFRGGHFIKTFTFDMNFS